MFVQVEPDPTGAGWHVYLSRTHPSQPGGRENEAWDAWAEDEDQLAEWLGPEEFDVEWLEGV